jgi:hypothetical protein
MTVKEQGILMVVDKLCKVMPPSDCHTVSYQGVLKIGRRSRLPAMSNCSYVSNCSHHFGSPVPRHPLTGLVGARDVPPSASSDFVVSESLVSLVVSDGEHASFHLSPTKYITYLSKNSDCQDDSHDTLLGVTWRYLAQWGVFGVIGKVIGHLGKYCQDMPTTPGKQPKSIHKSQRQLRYQPRSPQSEVELHTCKLLSLALVTLPGARVHIPLLTLFINSIYAHLGGTVPYIAVQFNPTVEMNILCELLCVELLSWPGPQCEKGVVAERGD